MSSETFVVREIVALRRLGLSVKVFSLHPPETGVFHPEAPDLAREVEVLIQPRNPLFWLAHLIFVLRFPGRYFRCLYAYVLTPDEPWRSRRRCLSYFMGPPLPPGVCVRPASSTSTPILPTPRPAWR